MSSIPTDLPIHFFPNQTAFTTFLAAHHLTLPGLHVKFANKASGIPSMNHAEAVEVALCYGWIDGKGARFDKQHHLSRFTPRRPKSLWSKKNVDSANRLMAEGKISPAGIQAIEAAKADGRWERAYAGPATIEVPSDFEAALDEVEAAKAFFEGLNRTDRFSVLWRVHTATPTARAGRIKRLIGQLSEGKIAGKTGQATPKTKAKAATGNQSKTKTKASKVVKNIAARKSKSTPTASVTKAKAPTVARESRRPGLRSRS